MLFFPLILLLPFFQFQIILLNAKTITQEDNPLPSGQEQLPNDGQCDGDPSNGICQLAGGDLAPAASGQCPGDPSLFCRPNGFCCLCASGFSIGPCLNGKCPNKFDCNPFDICCSTGQKKGEKEANNDEEEEEEEKGNGDGQEEQQQLQME